MAKKTTRRGAKKAHEKSTKQSAPQARSVEHLPAGTPLQHPDAVHLQRVENLPTELQSIIVDMQNNRDDPEQLFPAILDRLTQVRETVSRLIQGPHTAHMEAAGVPNQPLNAHGTPTRSGVAVGSERPTARAARGAQMHQAESLGEHPPGTPQHNPPALTPPAEQEPGAHA
jgi:hypothetical protein